MDGSLTKKFTGTHWWWWKRPLDYGEDEVLSAHIQPNGKEIDIDYKLEGEKEWLKLYSTDGIYFNGKWGKDKKDKEEGVCGFTLFKNRKGYFLYGGLDDDGRNYIWFISLKPEKEYGLEGTEKIAEIRNKLQRPYTALQRLCKGQDMPQEFKERALKDLNEIDTLLKVKTGVR